MKPTYTRRPMNNTEFVSHLMERSPAGLIAQLVIMTAIDNYTKACIAAGPGCLGDAGVMIGEESWLAACREIQQAMDARSAPASPYFLEELDTEHLDDGQAYVRVLNDNLQALREAAQISVNTLQHRPEHNDLTLMLRHGLTVTGAGYVDESQGE